MGVRRESDNSSPHPSTKELSTHICNDAILQKFSSFSKIILLSCTLMHIKHDEEISHVISG